MLILSQEQGHLARVWIMNNTKAAWFYLTGHCLFFSIEETEIPLADKSVKLNTAQFFISGQQTKISINDPPKIIFST